MLNDSELQEYSTILKEVLTLRGGFNADAVQDVGNFSFVVNGLSTTGILDCEHSEYGKESISIHFHMKSELHDLRSFPFNSTLIIYQNKVLFSPIRESTYTELDNIKEDYFSLSTLYNTEELDVALVLNDMKDELDFNTLLVIVLDENETFCTLKRLGAALPEAKELLKEQGAIR